MSTDAPRVALADTWHELVTVGLLGTDRRDPPTLPQGPLADTVVDALRPTPHARLLTAVAATAVARRCGATPLPPTPTLLPPDADDRPLLPAGAADSWREIVIDWPLLEAEWLAVAAAAGWRPAPDVLVALLRRHQRSALLAGAVLAWAGAPASWLVDHVPELAPADDRSAPPHSELRPLPVPAELEPLLSGVSASLGDALVAGLASGTYRWSHRAVLLNAVARAHPHSLARLIDTLRAGRALLDTAGDDAAPLSMWEALIELAVVRRRMLAELSPTAGGQAI